MLSTTAFLALAMQCASSIHPDTALDVARVESEFNPYAIGIVGQKNGIFPKNKDEALSHVKRLKSQGKRYSLGLMQITSTNFSTYQLTDEQLFNPCTNLSVFEKIMTDCYQRGGSLKRALSCYYSGNFTTGQKAERDFRQTSYVQRIVYAPGSNRYVVPGTREDKQATASVDAVSVLSELRLVWPASVVRGAPLELGKKKKNLTVHYPAQVVRGDHKHEE